jgi:hypothetical protein
MRRRSGAGPPRPGGRAMSVWASLYGDWWASGRAKELQVRREQAWSIRPERAGGNSPDAEGYSAFFDRSFSGGNLRGPLYKGPLVQ